MLTESGDTNIPNVDLLGILKSVFKFSYQTEKRASVLCRLLKGKGIDNLVRKWCWNPATAQTTMLCSSSLTFTDIDRHPSEMQSESPRWQTPWCQDLSAGKWVNIKAGIGAISCSWPLPHFLLGNQTIWLWPPHPKPMKKRPCFCQANWFPSSEASSCCLCQLLGPELSLEACHAVGSLSVVVLIIFLINSCPYSPIISVSLLKLPKPWNLPNLSQLWIL